MRAKPVTHGNGSPYGVRWDCPGCKSPHVVPTHGLNTWGFNENYERPTLTPSILIYATAGSPRCHSFIRDGRVEYCADSEHELAGQTIDLPDVA